MENCNLATKLMNIHKFIKSHPNCNALPDNAPKVHSCEIFWLHIVRWCYIRKTYVPIFPQKRDEKEEKYEKCFKIIFFVIIHIKCTTKITKNKSIFFYSHFVDIWTKGIIKLWCGVMCFNVTHFFSTYLTKFKRSKFFVELREFYELRDFSSQNDSCFDLFQLSFISLSSFNASQHLLSTM